MLTEVMSYPPEIDRGEGPSRITSPLMEEEHLQVDDTDAEEVEQELSQVK